MIRQKTWLLGWGFIAIYNTLNHWTNFNITWQKYSFGDPLLRFSSSCQDALKNMAGVWLGAGVGAGAGVGGGGAIKFIQKS